MVDVRRHSTTPAAVKANKNRGHSERWQTHMLTSEARNNGELQVPGFNHL